MVASFLFLAYLVKAGQVALTLRGPLVCPMDTNAKWTEIAIRGKGKHRTAPWDNEPVIYLWSNCLILSGTQTHKTIFAFHLQ